MCPEARGGFGEQPAYLVFLRVHARYAVFDGYAAFGGTVGPLREREQAVELPLREVHAVFGQDTRCLCLVYLVAQLVPVACVLENAFEFVELHRRVRVVETENPPVYVVAQGCGAFFLFCHILFGTAAHLAYVVQGVAVFLQQLVLAFHVVARNLDGGFHSVLHVVGVFATEPFGNGVLLVVYRSVEHFDFLFQFLCVAFQLFEHCSERFDVVFRFGTHSFELLQLLEVALAVGRHCDYLSYEFFGIVAHECVPVGYCNQVFEVGVKFVHRGVVFLYLLVCLVELAFGLAYAAQQVGAPPLQVVGTAGKLFYLGSERLDGVAVLVEFVKPCLGAVYGAVGIVGYLCQHYVPCRAVDVLRTVGERGVEACVFSPLLRVDGQLRLQFPDLFVYGIEAHLVGALFLFQRVELVGLFVELCLHFAEFLFYHCEQFAQMLLRFGVVRVVGGAAYGTRCAFLQSLPQTFDVFALAQGVGFKTVVVCFVQLLYLLFFCRDVVRQV